MTADHSITAAGAVKEKPSEKTFPPVRPSEGRLLAGDGGLGDDDGIRAPGGQLRQLGRADEQPRSAAERAEHARALRARRGRDRAVRTVAQRHAYELGEAARLSHRRREPRLHDGQVNTAVALKTAE